MNEKAKKKNINDVIFNFIETKMGPVFSKLGEVKFLQAIMNGMGGVIGILTIGSIFILLLGLATNYIPALAPLAGALSVGYNLTMGLTGLYVAVSVSGAYAKQYGLDVQSSSILGMAAFILLTSTVTDGTIAISNLGAAGIFAAILSSFVTVNIIRFCKEKNITINMPEGVPPAIAQTFASLIPGFISLVLMWLIKSVFNFDTVSAIQGLLTPLFSAVDNIITFTLRFFLGNAIWSVGLHADMIINSITSPFTAQWIIENADAFAAGVPANQLPHIWTGSLERVVGWTSSVWGLMFWMLRSKAKNIKAIAVAGLPSAIFTIIEPILFGLPIVYNPYLLIPFILSSTLAAFFTYGVSALGLVSRFYVNLPWITPPPILAFLGTGGDWKMVAVVVVNFLIGVAVYAPFFKAYEKSELEKIGAVK
ncbi:MAG TPA: PTS lactose transporter subunit IIC [Anaerolineaceae bacterium]|nr:PTS lactose transporter subunit IIC [Anaerolineaceae bacterium]